MTVAVITMAYNEAVNLPIWLRYYGAQVGFENLVVVDHGSDDGSTDDLMGAGHIRLPRGKFDDVQRAKFLSALHGSLLTYYDVVIYTDCDEMIVPDPAKHAGLRAYCEALPHDSVTAIGLNVIQLLGEEPPIDYAKPILGQRSHVRFVSPMCKTLISRVPIRWTGGFHGSSQAPWFDPGLYMFHLKRIDLDSSLARQKITRALDWASPKAGTHQRCPDEDVIANFQYSSKAERRADDAFLFSDMIEQFLARSEAVNGMHHSRPEFNAPYASRIPERFYGIV